MQSYKIFYNQAILSIARFEQFNLTDKNIKNYPIFDNSLNFEQIIECFLFNEESACILYKNSGEENIILENIKNIFHFQRAAGGIIVKNNAILSIYRYDRWDFPKGHVEAGETDIETAIREVTEETGIDKLSISKDLGYTYHIFPYNNHFALKETHWYEMHTANDKKPVPQTEESITDAKWIPLQDIHIIFQKTYPTLIELTEKLLSLQT